MQLLLLFYIWLCMTPEVWGGKGGSKRDPPYFTKYEMGVIKSTKSLWGRMVTTCANGRPAFFVWDPLTQYKIHIPCAACGQPLRVHVWHRRVARPSKVIAIAHFVLLPISCHMITQH